MRKPAVSREPDNVSLELLERLVADLRKMIDELAVRQRHQFAQLERLEAMYAPAKQTRPELRVVQGGPEPH